MVQPYFVLEKRKLDDSDADTAFLEVEPVVAGDAPRCSMCGGPVASLPWLPPHRAELETWGRQFGDVVFGPGGSLLVSERFAFLWEQEGLLGLKGFDPVEVTRVVFREGKIRDDPPLYYHVGVERSEVAIDDAASGLEREFREQRCSECRSGGLKRTRRVVLESPANEKRDLFIARGLPGRILASSRFEQFCRKHSIRNAVLIPAESYAIDYYPWRKS